MHQISRYFPESDCFFTAFYATGFIDFLVRNHLLDFTIMGGKFREQTEKYFHANNLRIDYRATRNDYDLVFTCQDILVQGNIKDKRLVLVQEGMTEPENILYHVVRLFSLPRWMAGTSATGLSRAYHLFFVASEGYRELFISKGIDPSKIKVTGIPNFDNIESFLQNEFPYRNFVLVATSDRRETMNSENRKRFLINAVRIANGRQIIFKLHPNENWERAKKEIDKYVPGAIVYTDQDINPMIANCDVLITARSTVVYIGMILGKEVHSEFRLDLLKKLVPIQNGGTSAKEIARISKQELYTPYYND